MAGTLERPWRSRRTEGSGRAPRPPPSQTGPVLRQHHGDRVQRRPDVAYGLGPAVYLLTNGRRAPAVSGRGLRRPSFCRMVVVADDLRDPPRAAFKLPHDLTEHLSGSGH